MNGLMNSVSLLIQRAINEGMSEQVLLQIQASLRYVNGQLPQKGWNVPGDRLEQKSEEPFSRKIKCSSRDELPRNLNNSDDEQETHDIQTRLIKSKAFFRNKKLTSIRRVSCLNKTFFTHFDYKYIRLFFCDTKQEVVDFFIKNARLRVQK